MGDDITIGVTEIVNNIEVTAQPNDQIVDISVIDNADEVTLNITPTVIEINVNKGSSYARWGTIYGNITDQTDLQNALLLKADLVDGKVPAYQLPSFVDDIIEVANYAALPATGEIGKIYVTLDNNKIYRWSGSVYIEIAANNAIWGAITGTLSSQTDLQNALNLKANDNAVVKLTGDQSITGSKSFTTNTAAPAMVVTNNSTDNGILLQNTSTGRGITSNNVSTGIGIRSDNTGGGTGISSSNTGAGTGIVSTNTSTTGSALSISNSSTGYGILLTNSTGTGISSSNTGSGTGFYSNNSSTGNGIQSINSSTGYGIISSNTGSGRGIYSSNNSTGDAINIANSGSGRGIYLTNASTGNSLILNNTTAATGMPFTIQKNGTDVFTINDAGEATGVKFIKSGGTSSQFLKADGSIDSTSYQAALTNPVTGTGTTNYFPKFTGASSLGNSVVSETPYGINVQGTNGGDTLVLDKPSGASVAFKVNGVYTGQIGAVGNDLYVGSKSIYPAIVVKDGGNVGIGTTSPSTLLHVYSSTTNAARVRVTGTGTTAGNFRGYEFGNSVGFKGGLLQDESTDLISIFTPVGGQSVNITSGGNVGIGTTSPSALLDINGTSTVQQNLSIANDRQFSLYSDGTRMIINSVKNVPLAIYTNDTERMRITSGGNVGIGTTSPSSLLHLYVPTGTLYQTLESNVINQTVGTITKTPSKSFFTGQNYSVTNNWEVYDITSSASRLSISPTGNVGIGTTSPDQKLTVEGNIRVGGVGNGFLLDTLGVNYTNGMKVVNNYETVMFSGRGSSGYVIAGDNNLRFGFGTNYSAGESMRITSGGNVGIGTTSPSFAFGSGLHVKSNSGWGEIRIEGQSFAGGTGSVISFTSEGTALADIYADTDKNLSFRTNGASERMRILANGNVGIGNTSPAEKLEVQNGTAGAKIKVSNTGGGYAMLECSSNATSTATLSFTNSLALTGGNVGIGTTSPTGRLTIQRASSGAETDIDFLNEVGAGPKARIRFGGTNEELSFWTGGTSLLERMRITSGGNLCIGTTSTTLSTTSVSAAFGVGGDATLKLGGYGGSTHTQVQFIHTGSVQGSIVTTNGAGTAYNTSSDYRLKEDLKPINGLDLISQINVYDYKWKSNETRAYGVLAHELQEVIPQAVNGEKDAEQMQSVDYSKLVPILVQAIQELKQEIEILKNK